ncbi:MAG: phosphate ABC transporter permease subunit PstC [Nannocystaceae bacterium]
MTPPVDRGGRAAAVPWHERVLERLLLACGLLSIAITAAILLVMVGESAGFFAEVSLSQFLFDDTWTPLFAERHFGIWPLVAGTFLTSAIAIAVALPFGLLAAIYLGEFAPPRVRAVLKPTLELLAGVPTIVYGFFALLVLTPQLQRWLPSLAGFNALSPGIVMGMMIVPMITSLSEDAIRAVPDELREGAYALGAGKLATVFGVVLPTALSGIAASLVLAVSRAVGETMIVAIAAGQQPRLTLDPQVPIETMTAYIVQVALGDVPAGGLEYATIFVIGGALFTFTFAANLVSRRLARRQFRSTAT